MLHLCEFVKLLIGVALDVKSYYVSSLEASFSLLFNVCLQKHTNSEKRASKDKKIKRALLFLQG